MKKAGDIMKAVLIGVVVVALVAVVFLGNPSLTGDMLGAKVDVWVGHSGPYRSSAIVTQVPKEAPYSIQVSPLVVDPVIEGEGFYCVNAYFPHKDGHLQKTFCYQSIIEAQRAQRDLSRSAVFVSDMFSRVRSFQPIKSSVQ